MLRRTCAAAAGILTALVLQGALIAPLAMPYSVSLPVVFVACIGLVAGVPAGMSVGFVAGLVADLASEHPAGIYALVWMQVGLLCAKAAPMLRGVLVRIGAIALAAAVGTLAGALLLTMTGSAGATVAGGFEEFVPDLLGDLLLALMVLPLITKLGNSAGLRGRPAQTQAEAGADAARRRRMAEVAGLAGTWR